MTTKLAWESLSHEDNRLPQELRDAIEALFDAREALEACVKIVKPCPKGKKWVFTYKYGVAIAHADAGPGKVSYFD